MRYIRRKFKDAKIRHKILAMFFIIGIIPMLVLGEYSYIAVREFFGETGKKQYVRLSDTGDYECR